MCIRDSPFIYQLLLRNVLCVYQLHSGNGGGICGFSHQYKPPGDYLYSAAVPLPGAFWNERTCVGAADGRYFINGSGYHSLFPRAANQAAMKDRAPGETNNP